MKYYFFIFSIVLISCGSSHNDSRSTAGIDSTKSEISSSEPTQSQIKQYIEESLDSEFIESKIYDLHETLEADFNGDGKVDKATFEKSEYSGIRIIYGGSVDTIKLGFGNKFAHMTNFNWVDSWAIVNDSITFEILFENNEISGDTLVHLENPSIALIEEEASSGLITYKKGEFIWIHQTD